MSGTGSRRDRWVRNYEVSSEEEEEEEMSFDDDINSELSDFDSDDETDSVSVKSGTGESVGSVGEYVPIDELLGPGVLDLLLEFALNNNGFLP
jgi:hypothetical protein